MILPKNKYFKKRTIFYAKSWDKTIIIIWMTYFEHQILFKNEQNQSKSSYLNPKKQYFNKKNNLFLKKIDIFVAVLVMLPIIYWLHKRESGVNPEQYPLL